MSLSISSWFLNVLFKLLGWKLHNMRGPTFVPSFCPCWIHVEPQCIIAFIVSCHIVLQLSEIWHKCTGSIAETFLHIWKLHFSVHRSIKFLSGWVYFESPCRFMSQISTSHLLLIVPLHEFCQIFIELTFHFGVLQYRRLHLLRFTRVRPLSGVRD